LWGCFSAAIYPAVGGQSDPTHSDTGDTMMMGLYFALGIFLLLALRNPSAHRSLIAFAGLVELRSRRRDVRPGI